MAKEEEQRIGVVGIAPASIIDIPNGHLTRSVTGLCPSADNGNRTAEYEDKDAARVGSKPKPRADDGSSLNPAETQDKQASEVLPELASKPRKTIKSNRASRDGHCLLVDHPNLRVLSRLGSLHRAHCPGPSQRQRTLTRSRGRALSSMVLARLSP